MRKTSVLCLKNNSQKFKNRIKNKIVFLPERFEKMNKKTEEKSTSDPNLQVSLVFLPRKRANEEENLLCIYEWVKWVKARKKGK